MKIIVNGLDLNEAVAKVTRALPSRDVTPILECIKITAEDDFLTLYATDKDLAIEVTVEANVLTGGETLVPGKLFAEYIKNIANESDISLEMQENSRLLISSLGSECTISTLDAEDYPEKEKLKNAKSFVVQEQNLKDIINKVIFAVATDDSRPILKGVYFTAKQYVLSAVATDGYRFAMCKKALEDKVDEITATVPSRSLSELGKLLDDSENIVSVCIADNYFYVDLGGIKLLTRLLTNGQYIKFDNLIPQDFVATLLVNKESFEKSLNTASIMSRNERNNLVTLDVEEYLMNISSTSSYGTANEKVTVSLSGQDFRCSYNAKYINDCLRVIDSECIKMQFAQHYSCVITINNSDEVLYFILPVRQVG